MLTGISNKKIHVPVRLRILVWFAVCILMIFGVALIIQGQMDLQNYHQQIRSIVKERTGRDIYIRGGVNVVLLPVPTIYVSGLELREINEGKPVPAVTVELLLLTPTINSLFSEHLEISSVAMENPTLEVERAADNIIYWDWLEKEIFELLKTDIAAKPRTLDISGGTVIYRNNVTGRKTEVNDINVSGTTGGIPNFSGSMKYNEQRFNLRVSSTGGSVAAGFIPISIEANTDNQDYIKLDGSARISAESLDLKGKMQVDVKDLYPWITLQTNNKKPGLDQFLQGSRAKEETQAILPVKFSGEWNQSGNEVVLSDVKWEGLNSQGAGKITLSFADVFSIDSAIHFSSLDYGKWQTLIRTLSEQLALEEEQRYVIDESLRESVLPDDLKLAFSLTSDEMLMGNQAWKNLKLNVGMEDAALTINQFFVELPGESTLALFGVISQSATTRGMRFEGSIETEGKSLKKAMSIFDESLADLPDIGFEKFFIRSNIYVSNDQIRLSEADVRFDVLQLGGGLVIYYDATNPRIEADVRLQDTNFDYFRDLWRERQKEATKDNFFLKLDKNLNFNWLRKLDTAIDLKINVERFTFLERSGDSAYLRLLAQKGELGVYNVRFYYPQDVMEMNLKLNVQNEKPFIDLLLNTSQLDTAYFSPEIPEKKEEAVPVEITPAPPETGGVMTISPQSQPLIILAQNTGESKPSEEIPVDFVTDARDAEKNKKTGRKWPEELIDMSWMDDFNGVFDITVGRFVHKDIALNDIKMRASLENSVLTAQGLSFKYWGGSCEVTGSMYGGKVPGISAGFTLYNVELKDMISSLVRHENISGKASISGTFSTSGVNYLSWLSQAEAKIALSGRGVRVEGFDLEGVVNTVNVSRTAADVLNNVNRALVRGSTRMSMDGAINVGNGVMRSPGITLKTGTIVGNLTGDISIVPWTLDLAMMFQFPALSAETIPTLLVQLNGSIDDPALTTDTSSLEAYVVKSIKEK